MINRNLETRSYTKGYPLFINRFGNRLYRAVFANLPEDRLVLPYYCGDSQFLFRYLALAGCFIDEYEAKKKVRSDGILKKAIGQGEYNENRVSPYQWTCAVFIIACVWQAQAELAEALVKR